MKHFRKIFNHQISWKSRQVEAKLWHAGGRTDRLDEANSCFPQFCERALNPTFCSHCGFVWIWEQTAIISLYSINWLVFITETQCVYCAVRTVSVCFVWIWEQTAIISLYSINWLVFITEMVCVYCAVRTGSVCVLCGSENKQAIISYTALTDWFLQLRHCVYCAVRTGSLSFVWVWEQTAIISCMFSFGYFPGVTLSFADVSEPSVRSIFKGWMKNILNIAFEDGPDRWFRNVGKT
jgi:hypothetical protein